MNAEEDKDDIYSDKLVTEWVLHGVNIILHADLIWKMSSDMWLHGHHCLAVKTRLQVLSSGNLIFVFHSLCSVLSLSAFVLSWEGQVVRAPVVSPSVQPDSPHDREA